MPGVSPLLSAICENIPKVEDSYKEHILKSSARKINIGSLVPYLFAHAPTIPAKNWYRFVPSATTWAVRFVVHKFATILPEGETNMGFLRNLFGKKESAHPNLFEERSLFYEPLWFR
jgi:hypothetical protein